MDLVLDRIQSGMYYSTEKVAKSQARNPAISNINKSFVSVNRLWKTFGSFPQLCMVRQTMCGCACGARRLYYRNSPGLMSATLERGHRDPLSVRRAGNRARRHEESERNAVGTLQCLDAPSPAHRSSAGFALSTLVMHRAVTAAGVPPAATRTCGRACGAHCEERVCRARVMLTVKRRARDTLPPPKHDGRAPREPTAAQCSGRRLGQARRSRDARHTPPGMCMCMLLPPCMAARGPCPNAPGSLFPTYR